MDKNPQNLLLETFSRKQKYLNSLNEVNNHATDTKRVKKKHKNHVETCLDMFFYLLALIWTYKKE